MALKPITARTPRLVRIVFRFAFGLLSVIAVARGRAQGQGVPAASAGTAPDLATLLAAQPAWSNSSSVQAGIGYKDNLLLSHAGQERSGFARGGFEAILWHVPRGRVDYSFFLHGEGTRYFSGETVDHEANAFAQAEWRYQAGDTFKFALDLQGNYLDEVLDVSDTDIRRVVAGLKVATAAVGPTVRWAFHRAGWVEAQGLGKRETYRDGANNNRGAEGTVRIGWRPGARVEASLAGTERSRDFDHRAQYSAAGRELEDTHLRNSELEGEGRLAVSWGTGGHWKTVTRAGVLRHTDNGSGYFAYRQRGIRHELEWTAGAWLVRMEGEARRLDFKVQTAGFGIFPPPRIKEEYSAQLRVERKLSARWTAFGEYTWERNRCNEAIASYRVNEGLLGAQWSWEK